MTDGSEVSEEVEEPGYGEALAELEAILARLEGDDLDVDVLAVQVRRAAELIAVCRARIDIARFEVTRVVAGLEDDSTGDDDESQPELGDDGDRSGDG